MPINNIPLSGQQLLEASAGTGKTYTITRLYLRLLLGRGRSGEKPLKVQEILVLTFTIAATQELKDRIREFIAFARIAFQAGHSEDPILQLLIEESIDLKRDQLLLTDAIQWLDDAAIHTIHGFCSRMLSENAFQAGVLFDQDLDADKATLLNLAAEDVYRSQILTLPALERALALNLWPDPQRLRQSLEPLLYRHNLRLLPAVDLTAVFPEDLIKKIVLAKRLWLEQDLSGLIANSGVKKNLSAFRSLNKMDDFCRDQEDLSPDSKLWAHWAHDHLMTAMKKGEVVPEHPCLDLLTDIHIELGKLAAIKIRLWHQTLQAIRDHLDQQKANSARLTVDDLLIQMQKATRLNTTWCHQLAWQFPAILVDEFQDTDDIQYEIFKNIHRTRDEHLLLLIGDPKQAIYQFRGADVYTYIAAKRESNGQVTLDTNYRSSGLMVEAINHLFSQEALFGSHEDILFSRSQTAPEADKKNLTLNNQTIAPVEFFIPYQVTGPLLRPRGIALSMAYAAETICTVLNHQQDHQMRINGEPVKAGQIALLTRNRKEARAARKALSERGINSVFVTQDSVLLEPTAADLLLILEGIFNPLHERRLVSAMSCHLIQSTMQEIHDYREDDAQQHSITMEFQRYQAIWKQQGVAAMIHDLINQRQLAQIWLGDTEGERQLTNLRHLAEILQEQSRELDGIQPLINWFKKTRQTELERPADNRQLRLESDQNLVKIVTMHSAKGLEYDIVVIPVGNFSSRVGTGKLNPVLFHREDESGQIQVCAELGNDEMHRQAAVKENLEEDMRLLYVAITRAKSRCLIGLPLVSGLQTTAIARLLGLTQCKLEADEIVQQLLIRAANIGTVVKVEAVTTSQLKLGPHPRPLNPPRPLPTILDRWQIHSYTGITRTLEQRPSNTELPQGYADDEPSIDGPFHPALPDPAIQRSKSATESGSNPLHNRFSFDRGPQIGVALHSMLEKINFQAHDEHQTKACQQLLQQLDLNSSHWLEPSRQWLTDILRTPLSSNAFALQDIALSDRIDELEFHFPITSGEALIKTCQDHGYLEGYQMDSPGLEGMMTGKIDLICRHAGQYFIIDYKSNFLGFEEADYHAAAITNAIRHHQYDLQYLIYSVALKKFLTSRLPGENFEKLFGGVYYLFLRGMNGNPGSGVYSDLPSLVLLQEIEMALQGNR